VKLVKVRMKRTTNHGAYGFLEPGQVLDVDERTAIRWARRGIAEVSDHGRQALEGNPEGHAAQTQPAGDLAEKTRNELVKLAAAAKVTGYGHMTKAELVAALTGRN